MIHFSIPSLLVRRIATMAGVLCLALWTALPAQAGTTGSLSGYVTDAATLSPISGAVVSAVSPSQTTTTTTGASGNYVFLSLIPDTYSVSVHKDGYETHSVAGISIFADQAQTVSFALQKAITTLGTVTVRSSLSTVRPGTITDVYSVNPALTKAAAPLGGGGGLDNAYSAIAS